jgi:hypothetical protein
MQFAKVTLITINDNIWKAGVDYQELVFKAGFGELLAG